MKLYRCAVLLFVLMAIPLILMEGCAQQAPRSDEAAAGAEPVISDDEKRFNKVMETLRQLKQQSDQSPAKPENAATPPSEVPGAVDGSDGPVENAAPDMAK